MTDKKRLNDLNAYIRQGEPEQAEIHPFREGNTRTTAVFVLKYLKTFGMEVDNDPLKKRQKQPLNRREIRAPVNGNLPLATPTFRRSCSFVPFLPSVLPGDLHPLRDLACLSIIIIHRAFQDISPLSF